MRLFTIVILLLLTGCDQTNNETKGPVLGEEFTLKIDEKVRLSNSLLLIHFLDVTEDSRCPEGLTCVWEGNAGISFSVNGEEQEFNTTGGPLEVEYDEFNIIFIALQPYPVNENNISREEYTLFMRVVKK